MKTYGQYCPIARTSEFFAERWTPIIVRNLAAGCTSFSQLREGAPGIPKALLAERLSVLERYGVIARTPRPKGRGSDYELTESGHELKRVCDAMGEWGARWWQYVFGIPEGENPLTDDPTGALCHLGQWGPVFFLVATNTSGPVTRSCDVPADTGLFFPIINSEVDNAVPNPTDYNVPQLRDLAKANIDIAIPDSLFATLDGTPVAIFRTK